VSWFTHKGLLLSLAGNLLLAGAVVWALTARKPTAPAIISLEPGSQSGSGTAPQWERIRSTDYAAYARNLRALGCPEASIIDLIVGEVTAQFSERLRTQARAAPYRFWESASLAAAAERSRLRQLQVNLERERREVLQQALGPGALQAMAKYRLWNDADPEAELLAFLPRGKLEQLQAINQKYATDPAADVALMSEAAMQRAAAERARQRAEIAGLLSAQELEELDLRKSETAERLRQELRGFSANEAEFRQLFRVRRAYEATLAANTDVRDPNVLEVRIEAERRFAEEARAALGEQRYGEYQRARDQDYQNALQLTQYHGLPDDVATRVYELKRDVDARAGAITANTALSEARRGELLAQIQSDTERTLQSLFGKEVLAEYRRNNRWWMGE
jgi:hypothetical protein